MIRTTLSEIPENKENIHQKAKTSISFPNQRSFGTDLTKQIPQFSQQNSNDPQLLDYYSEEIYEYLQSIESNFTAKYGYMKLQADITEKMRSVLIDWIVEVHFRFRLCSETLFLTVNIIDRYLEKIPLCRSRLQLIGVSALLIASKYEDIYPPETRDLVYITDKAYTKEDILHSEAMILRVLEYNITVPSAFRFLEWYSRLAGCCEQQFALARYLQELTLIDYRMIKYTNSMNAAASLYLMFKIKEIKPEWTEELRKATGYLEEQIKPCAKDMCLLFQNASKSCLKGIKTKFSEAQYFHVANTTLI